VKANDLCHVGGDSGKDKDSLRDSRRIPRIIEKDNREPNRFTNSSEQITGPRRNGLLVSQNRKDIKKEKKKKKKRRWAMTRSGSDGVVPL